MLLSKASKSPAQESASASQLISNVRSALRWGDADSAAESLRILRARYEELKLNEPKPKSGEELARFRGCGPSDYEAICGALGTLERGEGMYLCHAREIFKRGKFENTGYSLGKTLREAKGLAAGNSLSDYEQAMIIIELNHPEDFSALLLSARISLSKPQSANSMKYLEALEAKLDAIPWKNERQLAQHSRVLTALECLKTLDFARAGLLMNEENFGDKIPFGVRVSKFFEAFNYGFGLAIEDHPLLFPLPESIAEDVLKPSKPGDGGEGGGREPARRPQSRFFKFFHRGSEEDEIAKETLRLMRRW